MNTLSTRSAPSAAAVVRASSIGPASGPGVATAISTFVATLVGTILIGAPVAGIAALAVGAVAAATDARTGRIPNRLVALAAAAAAAGVVAVAVHHPTAAVAGAVLGTVAFAGPLFVTHLATPAAIGFGDVKLAAALGAPLGLIDPRFGLVALCIATGTTAIVGLARRRHSLPLGPALVLGAAAALLLTTWIPT